MDIVAYCFMPGHVHLLVEGCTDDADALAFVHQAKQRLSTGSQIGSRSYMAALKGCATGTWQP